ncbi:exonuclease SbcCD subunit D [candidate division KSB1 bacterium]|nr:exonuclease SbcCD subunit D [candidate division KSB1 bacterium]
MKIIHFSDTHLGFSEYTRIDPETAINQREKDFYNAWQTIITAILETAPALVVHAGDLFHTTRPTNRALAIALEGIQKISNAGIPFVLISGNHSTPKIKATGSIFEAISLFPNVFAAYGSRYEKFHIGDCDVHCVPHCSLSEELEQAFDAIEIDPDVKYNVLVSHGSWAGARTYSMGEFNEQLIPNPEAKLGKVFNYIALGHYHKHIHIDDHIVYSGSIERTSFNEAGYSSGYMLVDLAASTHDYIPIASRNMIKLPTLDCDSLSAFEIYRELEKLSGPELEQSLVSLELNNIQHDTLIALDWQKIDSIFQQVFHLEKIIRQKVQDGNQLMGASMDALPIEFERYLERQEFSNLDKARLKGLGLAYLSNAIDE